MQYPGRFASLHGYPFPRLRGLLDGISPGGDVIKMSIGEPRHAFPEWLGDELLAHQHLFNSYPINNGMPQWQASVVNYMDRRFGAKIDADWLTPLNGTREGLYMAAAALFPERKNGKLPNVLIPNPFYQVYMMGARTLGLNTVFVDAKAEHRYIPDFAALNEAVLADTVALFMCSPSNPQGAVATRADWQKIIALAEKHDFLVLADECYSEIYFDEPPVSALTVAQEMGADVNRVIAFHSLSKRSNLPGLRSGFAVSGPKTMAKFRELRGYAGAPVPGPIQMASARLWNDDDHVGANRAQYAEKMSDVAEIFGEDAVPGGGFFLWLQVDDGEKFTRELWAETGVEVLPGAYLAVDGEGGNLGSEYIRIALVDPQEKTRKALKIIKNKMVARS